MTAQVGFDAGELARVAVELERPALVLGEVPQATLDLLAERALAPEVRENGGRGIGNLVEDAYLNPLSTFIFDENVEAGEAVEAVASAGAVTFRRADEGAGATDGC